MKAHSRHLYGYLINVILPQHLRFSSGFLGFRRQNLLGHAVAVDRGRETAINGDLP